MLTASKSLVCRFTIQVEASRFPSFERSSSWQLKGCEETFSPVTILQPRHRSHPLARVLWKSVRIHGAGVLCSGRSAHRATAIELSVANCLTIPGP
jgi:hypothetical protein